MCVYRGMDIGTSKPDAGGPGRRAAPPPRPGRSRPGLHRDRSSRRPPARPWTDIAGRAITRCSWAARGSTCGPWSTTWTSPAAIPDVAAALEAELDDGRREPADLHARLRALDPVAAARMEPTNRRRVVRALEVTLGSGRPFSDFGPGLEAYPADGIGPGRAPAADPTRSTAGSRPASPPWSRPACVDEVRALVARPGGISRTARQALGLPRGPGPRGGRRPARRPAWRRRSAAPASSPGARPRGSAATPGSPGPGSGGEAQDAGGAGPRRARLNAR